MYAVCTLWWFPGRLPLVISVDWVASYSVGTYTRTKNTAHACTALSYSLTVVLYITSFAVSSTVTVVLKGRSIKVTGPRGTLEKDFSHSSLEMEHLDKSTIRIQVWFAGRKQVAGVNTIASHIENMFKGVLYVRWSDSQWEGVVLLCCKSFHKTSFLSSTTSHPTSPPFLRLRPNPIFLLFLPFP